MAMKYLKLALLSGIVLATVVFNPADLPSCGPFFAEAVFTETRTPPLSDYYQGRLGVLQPTFTRKYLFVAYRYLSGQPLTGKEVASLTVPSNESSEPGATTTTAIREWLDARSRIPGIGPPPEIRIYRNDTASTGEWRYFVNCTEDAFRAAARTLDGRIRALGTGNPGIKSWGMAQDLVFSDCSKGEAIPALAEAQLPQPLQYDRAYQIAAAHFYSEHYDTAAGMFRTIAANNASPWSAVAPYLAVRCLIRKATVPQKYRAFDQSALVEAEQELRVILQDKSRSSLYAVANKLEAFIELRLHPLGRIRTLAESLQRQASAGDFEQDLVDYLYLMDHFDLQHGFTPESARQTSDMTDWILTFPGGNPAHSLERWKTTGSAAWLLAVLIGLSADDPDSAAVLEAAQKFPKHSPAFATAQYHRIRLLMESGKENEARAALDALLPDLRTSLQNSSLNLFLAERLRLARNFEEFLEFAPRIPQSTPEEDFYHPELKEYMGGATPLLDADSIKVLNRGLPLSFLSRAAMSKLPLHLRKQLLRAAWVRAVLISDNNTAAALSGELERIFPDLKADLGTWLAAKDAGAKQFALAMLLMHFPGMSPYLQSGVPRRGKLEGIDDFRENWWCGFNAEGGLDAPTGFRYSVSRYQKQGKPPDPAEFPAFLNGSDKAAFMGEWKELAAVPTAPDYFGKIVLSWAAKHPEDERVPEALHRLVQSTRLGCTDSESGRYSRSAFQLLHTKYPNTDWAKHTPYWFR
jgi:hypothetical protein